MGRERVKSASSEDIREPAPAAGSSTSPRLQDFELLQIPLLNPSIRISQSIAWFEDRVVLGTGRPPLGFLGRFTGRDDSSVGGGRADMGGRDQDGAQILTFDPTTRQWEKIYDSPIVAGRDGKTRARDRSVRAALVCRTAADSAPTLYFAAGSLERNVVFLRKSGQKLEECAGSGFNLDADIASARSMACLDGRLFSTPTGKNYSRGMFDDNLTDHPIVFETSDPLSGIWVAASEPGFGDNENMSINELAVFNDCLYAGALNPRYGFQIWKTDAQGRPPYRWHKLIDKGAWLGASSSIPEAMVVFEGALYVSGAIQRQGRRGLDRFGPFPGEMIRLHPDDTWELVMGKPRFTPHGLKKPITGLTAGFGDLYTHAVWRMTVHDGRLYAGTAGWRWMPTYLRDRTDLSRAQLERLQAATAAAEPGEFALWTTTDGTHWEVLTLHGFPDSSPHNYGVRELLSTPHGLFVAPAAKLAASKGGGIELWWGHA